MDLQSIYQTAIDELGFTADEAQSKSITVLNRISTELGTAPKPSWITRLKRHSINRLIGSNADRTPVRGAYFWGGVGRGKTFMMDLFFENLPFTDKLRYHFHRLMYHMHSDLKKLKNNKDPVTVVANDLASKARVICFDEFFVADIADAMLLGKLLNALFQRGVTLVATSNIPPDGLYHDGLQRQQFLPAIDLIKQHTEVINVAGDTDYRLRVLQQAEIYHSPIDEMANRNLKDYFSRIAPEIGTSGQNIEILGRNILTCKRADGIAWFDFTDLCDGPRSQDDYIEVARSFQTVILSNVPLLDELKENQARRLIALVDEFYDRRVKLIISAAAPIEEIYSGSRLQREFERTRSRLREMQSTTYLAAAHLP
ncbi:MAG: cell division protein ZapE [Gammaproteobacteria bacterium]|nr:cell division protein ZapE [Gammaproteobacteria bacterium]